MDACILATPRRRADARYHRPRAIPRTRLGHTPSGLASLGGLLLVLVLAAGAQASPMHDGPGPHAVTERYRLQPETAPSMGLTFRAPHRGLRHPYAPTWPLLKQLPAVPAPRLGKPWRLNVDNETFGGPLALEFGRPHHGSFVRVQPRAKGLRIHLHHPF